MFISSGMSSKADRERGRGGWRTGRIGTEEEKMSEYKGNGERRDRNRNEENKINRKKIKEGKYEEDKGRL